jgi:hypothetical protein
MKKLLAIIGLILGMTLSAQELSVMTYNIKLDYPKEGENSWTNRKPFFINQLKFYEPDVFGVQEAMPNQMKDMDSLLTDYSFVGVGRDDGKDEGEYSAIFYKKDKFKVLESSTFWLSQTPEKVSMGWDPVPAIIGSKLPVESVPGPLYQPFPLTPFVTVALATEAPVMFSQMALMGAKDS